MAGVYGISHGEKWGWFKKGDVGMMYEGVLFNDCDDVLQEETMFWLCELLPVDTQLSFGLV
jgi:hypothetical protein